MKIARLFPLANRKYSLAEKYVVLAVIHDAAIRGQATILPSDISVREEPKELDCIPVYIGEINHLQGDVEGDVLLMFKNVVADLDLWKERNSKKADDELSVHKN